MKDEIIWSTIGLLVGVIAFACSYLFRSMLKSSFRHPLRESQLVYQSGMITEAPPAKTKTTDVPESHVAGVR